MDLRVVVLFVGLAACLSAVRCQECNSDNLKSCKRDGLQLLSNPDHSNSDRHCRALREQFDCVMWQTSMCLDKGEQEDNRDTISRLWRYLKSFCETQGNWYTKTCFQRDDVRRCEGLLPSRGYSTDTASCRSFANFRDCVTSVVLLDCSSSDQSLLGTYLMEKGQQRAWNCPRSTYTSASLAARDDSRYASVAASSYAGECTDASRYALDECQTTFDDEEKETRERKDSDMRHHRTCCSLLNYETCVRDVLERRCDESKARSETRALAALLRQRFPYHSCEDHTEAECNAAGRFTSQVLYLLMAVAVIAVSRKAMRV